MFYLFSLHYVNGINKVMMMCDDEIHVKIYFEVVTLSVLIFNKITR